MTSDSFDQRPNALRRLLPLLVILSSALTFVEAAPVTARAVALPVGASAYVPLTPTRLADTRPSEGRFGFAVVDANTLRIDIAHRQGVPAAASAVVINIAVIGAAGPNFVVAYPTGSRVPSSSNVNTDTPGQVMANLATVKVGEDGSIDLRMHRPVQIAVDLVGVYVPVDGAVAPGRLVTIPGGSRRVLDTRDRRFAAAPRSTTTVDLTAAGVPVDALAVVATITAVQAGTGFWTAFTPGRGQPGVSSLNIDTPGQTRANQVIVALNGTTRTIEVYSKGGGHLVVDVVGWFTGPHDPVDTAGLFVPNLPIRTLDTRLSRTLAPWARSTFEVPTGSPFAQVGAIAMNVTAVAPWSPGYVVAFPAGTSIPLASNLNLPGWKSVVAAHAIVAVSSRGAALYTHAGAHLIADIAGWYVGQPLPTTRAPQPNPNFAPNLVTSLHIPALGVSRGVRSGTNSTRIVDQGLVAVTGNLDKLASPGNVMLFAHRTSGSATFRHIDRLRTGNSFTLLGADGHTYNYVVVRSAVTSPAYEAISAQASGAGPVTAQLVACARADGSPGGIAYRIVVTARLVSVT